MAESPVPEVDRLLGLWAGGDRTAFDRLIPLVYGELREIAHRHRARWSGHDTVSTTVLVHETYLKLSQGESGVGSHRNHFLAVASRAMRQLLIDYARAQRADKRGGEHERVSLEAARVLGTAPAFSESTAEVLVALDEGLHRLEREHEREARVIECRFFGDMTSEETAEALGMSLSTVKRAWNTAREWLQQDLAARSGVELAAESVQSMLEAGAPRGTSTGVGARSEPGGAPSGGAPTSPVPGYDIEVRLGGGVCEVYRAVDVKSGSTVALKVSVGARGSWGAADVRRRLELEGDVLSRLRHPAVPRLLERGRTPEGEPYLVLEFIEGVVLNERLRTSALTAAQVARGGAVLAEALAEAHATGVIHRDLKSSNIVCNEPDSLRLLDFGTARMEGVALTDAGITVGTLEYMAPEQLTGLDVEPASDVFSLAVVLLEALGRHPFRHESMRETLRAIGECRPILFPGTAADEVTVALRRLLAGCLRTAPAERPTATALAAALQGAAGASGNA